MTPSEVFAEFARFAIVPGKADRFALLARTKSGQQKILEYLPHEFGPLWRSQAMRLGDWRDLADKPCFLFERTAGFGIPFDSARQAYDWLSGAHSWLILLQDGSTDIYCEEDGWYRMKILIRTSGAGRRRS